MLRLLLLSSFIAPVVSIPFLVSAESQPETYERPSYEEVYVAPVIEKLKLCESAELDVFFHEKFIETHSAQHLGETLSAASTCGNVSYIIQPKASGLVGSIEKETLAAQMEELSLTLAAYGANSKVNDIYVQESPDAFLLNGRAAVLKIVIKNKESA